MKKMLCLFILAGCMLVTSAQSLEVISAIGGLPAEPDNTNQDAWENNAWNGKRFYQAKGNTCKLAITDGTAAGTMVIADLGAVELINTFPAQDFIYIITNEVVFSPSFGIREKLWKSDGTTSGTQLVMEFAAHGFSASGVDAATDVENERNYSIQGNRMFFTGFEAASGAEPWVTDGTAAGTRMIKDIKPGTGASFADGYIYSDGWVYFRAAAVGNGATLWRTDGTQAGTAEIVVPQLTVWSTTIAKVNNKLVFIGNDNYVTGPEPWVSDGTIAGTFQLKDINPGTAGSMHPTQQNIQLRFNDQYVFFVAINNTDTALWRTDGTTGGTIQLTATGVYTGTNYSGGGYCALSNSQVFWINNNAILYYTDGTAAETRMIRNDLQNAIYLVRFNNSAWFNSGAAGSRELWSSDASANGTVQAVDVNPGLGESYPYGLFTLNNSLYFFANNGSGVKLLKYTAAQSNSGFVFSVAVPPGNWNEPLNWSGQVVPGPSDSAVILNGRVIVSGTIAAGSLHLGAGASVELPLASDTLVVLRNLRANGNNITGNGVLQLQGGVVPMLFNGALNVPRLYIRNQVDIQSGNINVTGE